MYDNSFQYKTKMIMLFGNATLPNSKLTFFKFDQF